MKKFELMTAETINNLTNTNLKKELRSLNTEGDKLYRSTWAIAESYKTIVDSNLFVDDFDSLTAFAKFTNTSTSNISRLTRCVDFRNKYGLEGYTVGAVAELLPLENSEVLAESDILELISKLNPLMTVKAIRELVKWALEKPVNPLEDEPEAIEGEPEATEGEPEATEDETEPEAPTEKEYTPRVYAIGGHEIELTHATVVQLLNDYYTENNLIIE